MSYVMRQKQYVIDAIATYICVTAKRLNLFTPEVDTSEMGRMLDANETEQEKARHRAREILRDFL